MREFDKNITQNIVDDDSSIVVSSESADDEASEDNNHLVGKGKPVRGKSVAPPKTTKRITAAGTATPPP